jgi:hypothetical protein
MRNTLVISVFALLALSACKKDDAASKTPNLLDRVVAKEGTDSTVTVYGYDSQKRFITETSTGTGGSSSVSLVRDANGRITRVVENDGSNTYLTDYVYQGPSDRKVRNGVYKFSNGGIQITDSIAFTYGSKVNKTGHFYSAAGVPTRQFYYYEYTYDSRGNMSSAKVYQDGSGAGTLTLQGTITFQYDDKINPIYSNDDALVEFIGSQYTSPNNITQVIAVGTDPANNFSATIIYEYRSDGRPTQATTVSLGSRTVATYTYKN